MSDTPQADRIRDAMRAEVEKQAKALILDIVKALVRATPIDTGHARRNWIPSVGVPVDTETDDAGATARGVLEVLGYKLGMGPLWVANPVDYVEILNYGTSTQAPAGWIEVTVLACLMKAQQRANGRVDISALTYALLDTGGGIIGDNLADAYSPFGDE